MYDNYRKKVAESLQKNLSMITGRESLSATSLQHIEDVAVSIILTREKLQTGGSFVQAIVDNDLEGAIGRADSDCARALRFFVYVKRFIS
jgi:hypothetical protein